MPEPPSVSVVLPFRNAEATLATAALSILCQVPPPGGFELLLVDNASTDGSPAIAAALNEQFANLRVLQEARLGVAHAMNRGVAAAKGTFLARMDADDWAHPHRLLLQARYLQGHPAVDGCASCVRYGGDPAAQAGYAAHVAWTNRLLTPDAIALGRFIDSPVVNPSMMFRRRAWVRFGGCRAGDFPEDYEQWLRWLHQGARLAKLPEALLTWNDPPARLTRTDAAYATEAFFRVKAPYLAAWLRANNPFHPAVWVWGAGKRTRQRVAWLQAAGIQVAQYIDIKQRNPPDAPSCEPAVLPPPGQCFVVPYVAKRGVGDQIETALRQRGYRPGRDYIRAA